LIIFIGAATPSRTVNLSIVSTPGFKPLCF
jgi:hypothetical protein